VEAQLIFVIIIIKIRVGGWRRSVATLLMGRLRGSLIGIWLLRPVIVVGLSPVASADNSENAKRSF
jgi:hypothetical protein